MSATWDKPESKSQKYVCSAQTTFSTHLNRLASATKITQEVQMLMRDVCGFPRWKQWGTYARTTSSFLSAVIGNYSGISKCFSPTFLIFYGVKIENLPERAQPSLLDGLPVLYRSMTSQIHGDLESSLGYYIELLVWEHVSHNILQFIRQRTWHLG